jgi:hypothetical protein
MDAARGRPRRLVGAKCDLPSKSVDDAHSGSSAYRDDRVAPTAVNCEEHGCPDGWVVVGPLDHH